MPRLALYCTLLLPLAAAFLLWPAPTAPKHTTDALVSTPPAHTEIALFGAGCFWGVEQAFRQTPGVVATAAGYAGGVLPRPTYAQVCANTTGHDEVVRVTFDPAQVSYDQLLDRFWTCHDPTAANGLAADGSPRSRSVLFFTTPDQERAARASLTRRAEHLGKTILTSIRPSPTFWRAEEYHQQYHEKNGGACRR